MTFRYVFAVAVCASFAAGTPVHAQPAAPLRSGAVSGTLTSEVDMTSGVAGDIVSVAPDLAVGVMDELTLAVVHSQFARTGFRGVAGTGVCVTEGCPSICDNLGLEALYGATRGAWAISANPGVHAWSFDRDHYVAKLGAKLRYKEGRVVMQTLPAVTLAITERDGMPANRDRLWWPVTLAYAVVPSVSLGAATGLKLAFDAPGDSYEVALGAFTQYVHSPTLTLGASWIHGRAFAGSAVSPGGIDSRVLNVWVTITR